MRTHFEEKRHTKCVVYRIKEGILLKPNTSKYFSRALLSEEIKEQKSMHRVELSSTTTSLGNSRAECSARSVTKTLKCN